MKMATQLEERYTSSIQYLFGVHNIKLNNMWREIKLWLTSVFIMWAFDICPNGYFKNSFAQFLRENITDLK
jgi:hypothetical protein